MKNFPFNVLGAVQTVIGKQDFQLRKPVDRVRNEAGYYTTGWSTPVDMSGSVQPVNSRQYKELGLDLKKSYIKIYSVELIETMKRNKNADQVIYDGYLWAVPEDVSWSLAGGWNYVLCVKLEEYTP